MKKGEKGGNKLHELKKHAFHPHEFPVMVIRAVMEDEVLGPKKFPAVDRLDTYIDFHLHPHGDNQLFAMLLALAQEEGAWVGVEQASFYEWAIMMCHHASCQNAVNSLRELTKNGMIKKTRLDIGGKQYVIFTPTAGFVHKLYLKKFVKDSY